MNTGFVQIQNAVAAYRRGGMVIIVDDRDPESEGDLACAAEICTAEKVSFMAANGRGLICPALEERRLDELDIPRMVASTSRASTAFAQSVDAREGVTTGNSAADRATTIKALINPEGKPGDFVKPGHVFPLGARDRGVLVRNGQTEASVDLARMAGMYPAGVICEIMNDDGTMARMPRIKAFAEKHDLLVITIADLASYRRAHEELGGW